MLPPLHQFVLDHLGDGTPSPLRASGGATTLLVDGASLASILYPAPLDCLLPRWKELHARVRLFTERLVDLGFALTVVFTVPTGEQPNVEAKRQLLAERSQFVQRTLEAVAAGGRVAEGVHYTPVRLIKSTLIKAFQSLPGVEVVVAEGDVARAMAVLCAQRPIDTFGVATADVAPFLWLPIPSLCPMHPGAFPWEAFWKGAPVEVRLIHRYDVVKALAPERALPVFATLLGNPLFPRTRLEGFFPEGASHPEILNICKSFIRNVLRVRPDAALEDFAAQVFDSNPGFLGLDIFVAQFLQSCHSFILKDGEALNECSFETIPKSPVYFFEPALDPPGANPTPILLRPLRLRTLHAYFGGITFAEMWVAPGATCTVDYITLPASPAPEPQIARRTLLERVEAFETVSGLDLSPMQIIDGNAYFAGESTSESWLCLVLLAMATLGGRAAFTRHAELQLLVAQFVALPDAEPHLLPAGFLTVEKAALCHLFHGTLSHLSRLNSVCGSPFAPYNEWELYDGAVAAVDLPMLLSLPAFVQNQERYERLMAAVERALPEPLLDGPLAVPTDAQRARPRTAIPAAAEYRAMAPTLGHTAPVPSSPVFVRVIASTCTPPSGTPVTHGQSNDSPTQPREVLDAERHFAPHVPLFPVPEEQR